MSERREIIIDHTLELAEPRIYCLFCLTGHEEAFDAIFNNHNMKRISLYAVRTVMRNGKKVNEQRQLLPGYVLFEAENFTSSELLALRQCGYFLRMLEYEYGDYHLRGRDLEFVRWLRKCGGVIDVSRVYREGDRIKVVDGPLKNFEGSIIAINKKRNCVAIRIAEGSVLNKIWCSIEYIEANSANP